MVTFGSYWDEDDKPIGPMAHWLEDYEEIDDTPLALRSLKEIIDDKNIEKKIGPMSSWLSKDYNKKHK